MIESSFPVKLSCCDEMDIDSTISCLDTSVLCLKKIIFSIYFLQHGPMLDRIFFCLGKNILWLCKFLAILGDVSKHRKTEMTLEKRKIRLKEKVKQGKNCIFFRLIHHRLNTNCWKITVLSLLF